jgi:hypothetical protein
VLLALVFVKERVGVREVLGKGTGGGEIGKEGERRSTVRHIIWLWDWDCCDDWDYGV